MNGSHISGHYLLILTNHQVDVSVIGGPVFLFTTQTFIMFIAAFVWKYHVGSSAFGVEPI